MKFAFGVMHMSSGQFWGYSMVEWQLACRGFIEAQGGGSAVDPMTHEELDDLMEAYPDVPGNTT